MKVQLVTVIVDNYDEAIAFFTDVLGFELTEDSPSLTSDGRAKRWVVVTPPGAETGLLLAKADGRYQEAAVGEQVAGRVGFLLEADDFEETFKRIETSGAEIIGEPREESYGQIVVFRDIAGNKWDLLGPKVG